ncbi:hypothetical protein D9619_007651 [Psilocybe cf. subviscida]|uniref:Uncharacterized protein n=1 Tax=Psilocybe cf. subviscida TaxID=2480587 RepID=A0A8H5ET44_9AGAR|nr:hypothetical protein D9619_007651 [Psilocybe cf. subviscida]
MQSANGSGDGARGVKRAVKVEEDVSPDLPKRQRRSRTQPEKSHTSIKLEERRSPGNSYRTLPQMKKEQQSISSGFSITSSATVATPGSSLTTTAPSGAVRLIASAPPDVTGSPPYAYFTWNYQALSGHATSLVSRPQEKGRKVDVKTPSGRGSSASTSMSVSAPSTQVTECVNLPTATRSASTPAIQKSAVGIQTQTAAQALYQISLQQRLEAQLELRHATLLAHINARYGYILDDDRRRRAAYQEAAFQRAMEIGVEEHWATELRHLIGLMSPALSTSASISAPSSSSSSVLNLQPHAEHTHVHSFTEIQRDRDYLQLLIANTDMHVSTLRDAHRVAYEREVIEAQFAARALRELEVRRDALVLCRTQEMRYEADNLNASESVPMVKTRCSKVDCLGCSKDGCVSNAVAAVRERVAEMARRIDALNRA